MVANRDVVRRPGEQNPAYEPAHPHTAPNFDVAVNKTRLRHRLPTSSKGDPVGDVLQLTERSSRCLRLTNQWLRAHRPNRGTCGARSSRPAAWSLHSDTRRPVAAKRLLMLTFCARSRRTP